jgi:hypothetical protein
MIKWIYRKIFGKEEDVRGIKEGPDEIFDLLLRAEFERDFEFAIELSRIPESEKTEEHKILRGMLEETYKLNGICPSASYWRASDFQKRCYDGIHKGICRQLYGEF